MRKTILFSCVAAGLAALSSPTTAAIVGCTVTDGTPLDTYSIISSGTNFSIKAGGVSACLAGVGNINGNPGKDTDGKSQDAILDDPLTEYQLLDKSDDSSKGLALFNVGGITNTKKGSFTIDGDAVDGFTSLLIAFKAGNQWAAFLLDPGVLSGSWTLGKGLSHANLYGIVAPPAPPPTAVPGPIAGAGLPALLALGGFIWARRRKAVVPDRSRAAASIPGVA